MFQSSQPAFQPSYGYGAASRSRKQGKAACKVFRRVVTNGEKVFELLFDASGKIVDIGDVKGVARGKGVEVNWDEVPAAFLDKFPATRTAKPWAKKVVDLSKTSFNHAPLMRVRGKPTCVDLGFKPFRFETLISFSKYTWSPLGPKGWKKNVRKKRKQMRRIQRELKKMQSGEIRGFKSQLRKAKKKCHKKGKWMSRSRRACVKKKKSIYKAKIQRAKCVEKEWKGRKCRGLAAQKASPAFSYTRSPGSSKKSGGSRSGRGGRRDDLTLRFKGTTREDEDQGNQGVDPGSDVGGRAGETMSLNGFEPSGHSYGDLGIGMRDVPTLPKTEAAFQQVQEAEESDQLLDHHQWLQGGVGKKGVAMSSNSVMSKWSQMESELDLEGIGDLEGLEFRVFGLDQRVFLGLLAASTFMLGPWAVQRLRPGWSYGKRLGTSMLVGTGIGLVRAVVAPREKPLTA